MTAIVCPRNGTYLTVQDGPTLQWGTADFGIIAVARFGGPAYAYEKINPMGGGPGVDLGVVGGNYSLGTPGGNVVLAGPTATSFHIVAGRGALLRLAADGPTNTQDISFPGGTPAICMLAGQGTTTELAELILVKGTLSDADLANAVSYLKSKFKL